MAAAAAEESVVVFRPAESGPESGPEEVLVPSPQRRGNSSKRHPRSKALAGAAGALDKPLVVQKRKRGRPGKNTKEAARRAEVATRRAARKVIKEQTRALSTPTLHFTYVKEHLYNGMRVYVGSPCFSVEAVHAMREQAEAYMRDLVGYARIFTQNAGRKRMTVGDLEGARFCASAVLM